MQPWDLQIGFISCVLFAYRGSFNEFVVQALGTYLINYFEHHDRAVELKQLIDSQC